MTTADTYEHLHLVVNGLSILNLLRTQLSLGDEVLTQTTKLYQTNPRFRDALENTICETYLPKGHQITSLSVTGPKEIHVWFITQDAFRHALLVARELLTDDPNNIEAIDYISSLLRYGSDLNADLQNPM